MKYLNKIILIILFIPFSIFAERGKDKSKYFQPMDVFQLEYASDPQISPDGKQIVYVRNFFDVMTDRRRSNLWIINVEGTNHRPITSGNRNDVSPRWSPNGDRLLYVSSAEGSMQIYVRWMDTGQTAKLTTLLKPPSGLAWSPDGNWITFTMFVQSKSKPFVTMPGKPEGAKWAKPAKVINKLLYRSDGSGYLEDGYVHLFVLPEEGGTPRQITFGDFNHRGMPAWAIDGKSLLFSANRHANREFDPNNSEIYEVFLNGDSIKTLTVRLGPDRNPVISPDGKKIAYLGYDDQLHGYHVTKLYVMNRDGSDHKLISGSLDRDVGNPVWGQDSKKIYFQYDDQGNTKIASFTINGKLTTLTNNLGGLSIGRPYSGGMFSIAQNGAIAFTHSKPDHPADVAVISKNNNCRRITNLNSDLFGFKKLTAVEELWCESSFDGRKIQGWIAKPPDFDQNRKYPLILEIHGGPFANYGDRFSAEVQLYAAAGFVVLYTNPRGSTSYGKEFGNLIHHNYPGQDYDDLMSCVDATIERGYIDDKNLFVTGGSGGGVLSSWIVGKTDRFRAAVVAKPVINWYSFVLTSDNYNFYYKYWFPGFPWEHAEHYLKRSPLSLVGNVKTPTMLLTGEVDYRTPISESEQYYQALKLRKIETALVRIPEASHGIASRPSYLISKVKHILKWFDKHKK